MKPPGIHDIARALGISIGTVDRAFPEGSAMVIGRIDSADVFRDH